MIREAARLPEVASELSTSRPLPVGRGVVRGGRSAGSLLFLPLLWVRLSWEMFLCPWGEGRGLNRGVAQGNPLLTFPNFQLVQKKVSKLTRKSLAPEAGPVLLFPSVLPPASHLPAPCPGVLTCQK